MEKFEVVIIGAGLGGLSAAAYLSKAGKKVLVLEHHSVPGGWTYPVLKDLGILDRAHFHRMDPFYTVCYPEHEVTAHADVVAYEAELIRHFPHEKENIRAMIAEMIETFFQVRRFGADGESLPCAAGGWMEG